MKQSKNIYEVFGWLGVFGILLSYGLLSFDIIDGSSFVYHGIILVSSCGLAVISYLKNAYQPLVLNVFFAIFAIIALIRLSSLA